MATLGTTLVATNPRLAVSSTSMSRRSGPPWPANRKGDSQGGCQRRLTKTRRLCDGLMNPGEPDFLLIRATCRNSSVALVERFRSSNCIDISLVQRSAHQSQACLTLATNSVEIGNSRFRYARLEGRPQVRSCRRPIRRDARQEARSSGRGPSCPNSVRPIDRFHGIDSLGERGRF
jgi:hypothetical protein